MADPHLSNSIFAAMCCSYQSGTSSDSKELSVEKLQNAKLSWYRQIQIDVYQVEYEQLKANHPLPNTSAILKLDPYYDRKDQLLRVGGTAVPGLTRGY